jgi:hypothetical protein
VSWGAGLIPFIGALVSDQIDFIYGGLIQPLIADTVYAISDVIADPLAILTTVGTYIGNLVYTGYTFITDEIASFGLPPILGPIPAPPGLASAGRSSKRSATTPTVGPRAAAAAATGAVTDEGVAPARAGRGAVVRAARAAAVGARVQARAVAAVDIGGQVRSPARASRGDAKANQRVRAAAKTVASAAS